MRIASLVPEAIVNSIYRSFVPMQALAHRGHAVHLEERNGIANPDTLLQCDIVQFLRFAGPEVLRMARRLKQAGVAVAWDNDDNITASQPGNPNYRAHSGLRGQQVAAAMAAMMRAADVVTTPSDYLVDVYRRTSGAEVVRIENFLPPTFVRPDRLMPHSEVIVGWLAAMEHQRDAEQLRIRETLERILARHQHVEVMTIGLDLGLRSRRCRPYPVIRYGELPGFLAHVDIGIAPLGDTPFNRGRSNVKLKEYAALGVPWLASPIGPYAGMGEDQGGRLVPDDRWYEEIERLVLDPDARSRLARRARIWAQGETIERHVEAWEATFEDAIERARSAHAVR